MRFCITTRSSKFYEKYSGMIVRTQSSFFSKSMLYEIGLMDEKLQFAMDRNGMNHQKVEVVTGLHGLRNTDILRINMVSELRSICELKNRLPSCGKLY